MRVGGSFHFPNDDQLAVAQHAPVMAKEQLTEIPTSKRGSPRISLPLTPASGRKMVARRQAVPVKRSAPQRCGCFCEFIAEAAAAAGSCRKRRGAGQCAA